VRLDRPLDTVYCAVALDTLDRRSYIRLQPLSEYNCDDIPEEEMILKEKNRYAAHLNRIIISVIDVIGRVFAAIETLSVRWR